MVRGEPRKMSNHRILKIIQPSSIGEGSSVAATYA